MAYDKTIWNNDTIPSINEDNLNKMEQGIYDSHGAFSDIDKRTNQILSYVNYGYDEPIDYPLGDGSVWNKSIGIFRNGTTIEVNKSVTTSVDIRAKLTGEFELAGNNSGVDAWTTGISFKTGHKYKLVARLISGTANYSSNIVSVYRTGEHASVGIATIQDGVFERLFTAEANTNYNVAFFAEAKATFSNAKFLLTIEDLTESQFVDLQEQIDEVKMVSESANYSLKSGNITPSGSAGSNNKYIRTYKNNMPKIEKGDILIAKGGFAISNIHIFSANTVASIAHITGLTFTDENRFEVPEEYVGKYLGYTVYEPAKSGQDISADVEDAIKNVSVLHTTYISEVIADLKSQVDAIETDSVSLPDYYFVDGYIDEKCNDINEIGVNIGRKSLRTVFFTDYHLEDNAKQTPNLINYLVEKTGIKNVVFGGDGFNHDYSSKVGGYDMLCEFLNEFKKVNEIANMYLITGNHEMNNADLDHDSVELSKAVPGNLFNNPIFYKIKTLWETGKDTNTFYVDDDVNKMRMYCIDCTSGASIQKSYLDVILPSFLTVPEGYAVIVFSHTGVKNYTKDETVDPPVYTVTELAPAFDAIMQTGKAMNDGANATITATIGGNTYTWNLDFSDKQRLFVGAIIGHVHFDSYYNYDDQFPVIVVMCDTGAYRSSHPYRVAGTITEQAFDVVQIDIATKRIYCTRIGFGNDRTFRFADTGIATIIDGIAYYEDGSNEPLKSCKVTMLPIQDLHGQSAPYPAGGSANIWDEEWVVGVIDNSGVYTPSGNRVVSKNFIPVEPNNQYYAKNIVWYFWYESDNTGSFISSGSIASGVITAPNNAHYLKFYTAQTYGPTYLNDISINYPSTDTAYHPYSNICPISGWDSLVLNVGGVNQWDEEWEAGSIDDSTGVNILSNNTIRSKNYIRVVENTNYYVYVGANENIRPFFYDANKQFISYLYGVQNTTITTPANAKYMRFRTFGAYGTTYNNDISINYPATDSSYHQYITPTTHTTTFPATVYGGEYEFVEGKGKETWEIKDLSSLNLTYQSGSGGYFSVNSVQGKAFGITNIICSHLATSDSASVSGMPDNSIKGNPSNNAIYIKKSDCTSVSELLTALSGAKVCYELATPQEISLTSQQIVDLIGHNIISAKPNDVTECKYTKI